MSDHDLKGRVVLNAGNYSDSTNTCPTMSIVPTGGLTDNEHCTSSSQDHGVGLPNTAQLKLVKLGAQAENTGSEDRRGLSRIPSQLPLDCASSHKLLNHSEVSSCYIINR